MYIYMCICLYVYILVFISKCKMLKILFEIWSWSLQLCSQIHSNKLPTFFSFSNLAINGQGLVYILQRNITIVLDKIILPGLKIMFENCTIPGMLMNILIRIIKNSFLKKYQNDNKISKATKYWRKNKHISFSRSLVQGMRKSKSNYFLLLNKAVKLIE